MKDKSSRTRPGLRFIAAVAAVVSFLGGAVGLYTFVSGKSSLVEIVDDPGDSGSLRALEMGPSERQPQTQESERRNLEVSEIDSQNRDAASESTVRGAREAALPVNPTPLSTETALCGGSQFSLADGETCLLGSSLPCVGR